MRVNYSYLKWQIQKWHWLSLKLYVTFRRNWIEFILSIFEKKTYAINIIKNIKYETNFIDQNS